VPNINFTAPPTCAAFMKSQAFFRLIAGPVGSGKTTACLFELFRRACEQAPAQDGYRYTRFAILRQTLSQLKMTVLKDVTTWLEGIATFKVSENTIHIQVGDVRSEWILIPLEDVEDQRRLLSSQLTGAWLSECIEIDVGLVPAIAGRCGRYPSKAQGGPTWFGIIADTNMPTIGSNWWKLMDQDVPPDWQVFIQPGGLEPDAENIENLPGGREYYERLARSNSDDWVKRYVHAQYGADPSGSAVFKESFKHGFHVADEVTPVNGYPLIIGQDFGRNPCSIITQLDHRGRLLVLEEVLADDIGLELHIQRNLRPRLGQERYLGRPVVVVGDPAGKQRSTSYEETSFDLLKREGFMCYPAPTNNIDARLRAVESFLLAQRDGGAAMLFDKQRCPQTIMGMGGGYRFAKTRTGQLRPVPDKNEFSHIADALQYAACAANNGMQGMISARIHGRRREPKQKVSSLAWT
jgi:hypothetical protein